MWYHMGDYGWGGMWMGMLLFWGSGRDRHRGAPAADHPGPRRCRRARAGKERARHPQGALARGEIGREEFQEKKRDLES